MSGKVVLNDVAYGNHERHKVDIFIPEKLKASCGVILFIHGGGWSSGDKNAHRTDAEYFSNIGYVSATMNYRFVTDELNVFDSALLDSLDLLNEKGRIAVITFHSLEDKICKYTFNKVSKIPDLPQGMPVIPEYLKPKFKLITRKPIIAGEEELNENHRSHSAKLRIIERICSDEEE